MNTIHKQLVNLVVLSKWSINHTKMQLAVKRGIYMLWLLVILQMQDFNLFSKIENNFQQICDIQNNQISIHELL